MGQRGRESTDPFRWLEQAHRRLDEAERREQEEDRRWIDALYKHPDRMADVRRVWDGWLERISTAEMPLGDRGRCMLMMARWLRKYPYVRQLPPTWEAVRQDPRRAEYIVWVLSYVTIEWLSDSGVMRLRRMKPTQVYAETLHRWCVMMEQQGLPTDVVVPLWWERELRYWDREGRPDG